MTVAREINNSMPVHVVKLVKQMIHGVNNPSIVLLGLAYKGNVDDVRESPTFKIKEIAEREGMEVKIYDPLVKNYPDNSSDLVVTSEDSDCLVLVTDNEFFKEIDPKKLKMRHKNLVDTRNILDHTIWKENGFTIIVLGKSID